MNKYLFPIAKKPCSFVQTTIPMKRIKQYQDFLSSACCPFIHFQAQVSLSNHQWCDKFSLDVIQNIGMTSCKGPHDKTYMVVRALLFSKRSNNQFSCTDLCGYSNELIRFNKDNNLVTSNGHYQSNISRMIGSNE